MGCRLEHGTELAGRLVQVASVEQCATEHGPGRHVDAGSGDIQGAGGRVRRARPFRRTGELAAFEFDERHGAHDVDLSTGAGRGAR